MRIIPYDGDQDLSDIESLSIVIKAVPFENSFVPAFFIQSPDGEYDMSMEELNSLMNGLDIAKKAINTIMAYIIEQSNEEDNFKNKKKGIIEDDE
jgi:hypothetical protein